MKQRVPAHEQLSCEHSGPTARSDRCHIRSQNLERRDRHRDYASERRPTAAGQGIADQCAPIVADVYRALVATQDCVNVQDVLHQGTQAVFGVGRYFTGRVAAGERSHHPPPFGPQPRPQQTPGVRRVRETVSAYDQRTVLRPPGQRAQSDVGQVQGQIAVSGHYRSVT
ncbi:Uncharacterised protein [Mycobacteroides abscessus subsp. abscessus]|nr:Uncharacterised protein [Mycobacteroides abscessus subsp. abscessus]